MVRNLFKKGADALNMQQQTILSAASVIGLVYVLSAFLGFIRNRILSYYFGDSPELGVFFAADDFPNLIFTLIVSGSLSSAFVPVFIKYFKKDAKAAWEITSDVMNTSIIGIFIFSVLIWFGSDFIAGNVLAAQGSLSIYEKDLLSSLIKTLMLAQFAFLFSSYFTSILHSFKRFMIPALAPVFMNFGVILFIVLFTPRFGIYAPAYGTIFGAVIHMLFQLPFVISLGFKYFPKISFRHSGVREIYSLMTPRILGQLGQKFLIPLNTNLALFISASSNVILTFADDLQSVPVRIFGMSIGQAALPILADSVKDNDRSEFKSLLIRTIRQMAFFVIPISIVFFILRVPLVRLSVGAKKYPWEATVMTAYVLGFFCISLIFQSLVLLLSKAYYALSDTKTPLIISLISVVINASTAMLFIRYYNFGVWSLALSYSIGVCFNAVVLIYFMFKRLDGIDYNLFFKSLNKIILASYAMGIALYIPMKALDKFIFDTTRTIDLIFLTCIVSLIGVFTFLGFSKLLHVEDFDLVSDLLRKFIKNRKGLKNPITEELRSSTSVESK